MPTSKDAEGQIVRAMHQVEGGTPVISILPRGEEHRYGISRIPGSGVGDQDTRSETNSRTDPGGLLPKMPQLDALRTFAVFAVMYQHFTSSSWLRYVPTGRIGVQLFFVLSGFLITAILLRARERIAHGETRMFEIRQFYARRFLRIFPLYYGVVIGAAFLGIPGFREPLLWHLGYATNIQNAITGDFAGASGHFWTLSVEEQFYFCWPWVILFTPRRWLLFVICAFAAAGPLFRSALVLLGYSNMPVYTLTPSSLDAFGLGALLALAREKREVAGDDQLRRSITTFGLLVGIPATVLTFWSLSWQQHYYWVFTVWANLALSLVSISVIDRAADGVSGPLRGVLAWRPLLFAGKISYGLYVFHFLIAYCLSNRILIWPIFDRLEPITRLRGMTLLTLCAMTFSVAALSWFFYERPLLSLKRWFPYARPSPQN
jgi:peptidoglycan/LPS O-acetylase OafA/YrhL